MSNEQSTPEPYTTWSPPHMERKPNTKEDYPENIPDLFFQTKDSIHYARKNREFPNYINEFDKHFLKVQLRVPNAKLPSRGTIQAAGYDLHSTDNVTINPGGFARVSTGISITTPEGTYGRIACRSSYASKGLMSADGVIDPDYTGIVKVTMYNLSPEPHIIRCGDRIAQLVLERIVTPEVRQTKFLVDTERGEGGFGSTGV